MTIIVLPDAPKDMLGMKASKSTPSFLVLRISVAKIISRTTSGGQERQIFASPYPQG